MSEGRSGLDAFVRSWAREIMGTSYVAMSRAQTVGFLRGQAALLVGSLTADTFDASAGRAVGCTLARADFTAPEALGRTVALVQERLLADAGLTGPSAAEAGRRLVRLTGALTEGFVRAVRDRTLDAQDDMRRATLQAKARAENALRESEARALHAALHDQLTGLPNRTIFTEWLAAMMSGATLTGSGLAARPASRFAVCVVGLDRFKSVNGTFGPAVGDRVLVLVAERVRALAHEFGWLVSRIGGDEFGFLVPDTTCTDDALKFADRALRRIAEPVHLDGREIPLSASAGVLERAAGGDPAEVMRAVTITLHWAKADGRGRCARFDAGRNAADVARYALSAALPAGLRNDEFTLVYQPLVDLRTGSLVGTEALARWRHPGRGELNPDEFIGLAEESGLIVTLGLRLLEKACHQALRWGPAAPFVSVNLAVRQIRDPGLVGRIAAVLDRVGLRPELLQLEITESAVMSIDDHTVGTLRALRRLGVRLVIDDFGTGYANLSYLCDLPVHGLKLAATFLRGLDDAAPGGTGARRVALLEAMVSVGHRLGLTVTAEGVETREQAEVLRRIGCDLAQGWLFGRPVPPGEVRLPGAG